MPSIGMGVSRQWQSWPKVPRLISQQPYAVRFPTVFATYFVFLGLCFLVCVSWFVFLALYDTERFALRNVILNTNFSLAFQMC